MKSKHSVLGKALASIIIASYALACAMFPQEERYVTSESINDNVTASEQQLAYWRSYGI